MSESPYQAHETSHAPTPRRKRSSAGLLVMLIILGLAFGAFLGYSRQHGLPSLPQLLSFLHLGSTYVDRILYTSNVEDKASLKLIDADGSNQTLLAADDGWFVSPKVNPERTRIVFFHHLSDLSENRGDLFTVSITGGGLKEIVPLPEWTVVGWKDQHSIFYLKDVQEKEYTYTGYLTTVDIDKPQTETVVNSAMRISDFTLSPDGALLAMVGSDKNIWTMRADGTELTRLTSVRKGEECVDPVFSPDGGTIIYTKARYSGFEMLGDLNAMPVDGGTPRQLTKGLNRVNVDPSFSPNGKQIVFSSGSAQGDFFHGGIYVMDADGRNQRELVAREQENPISYTGPSFSPDGEKIVYDRFDPYGTDGNPSSDIYLMNADGTGQTLLAEGGNPQWVRCQVKSR